jgi:ribonuclease VapC
VIDASAIVAIAFNAPEAKAFEQRIADNPVRPISAATVLEDAIVIEAKLGEAGGAELDLWLYEVGVEMVAVDAEQADLPVAPGGATAGSVVPPGSISAIASMPWRR